MLEPVALREIHLSGRRPFQVLEALDQLVKPHADLRRRLIFPI
jgi:hypothetical protein